MNISKTTILAFLLSSASAICQVPPAVFIDAPAAGASLSGAVTIAGWAIGNNGYADSHAITSVAVFVDGRQVGTAIYGISRPDVCEIYPGRLGCPNVGWNYSLNAAALASGSHTLTIVATDTTNNSSATSVVFTTAAPAVLPFVQIDTPTANATLTGTTTISGWAIENSSTIGPSAVSSVAVFVDGSQVGTAIYGISRPDVCVVYPGRLGCPNVGWNYSLNVAALASGNHTLMIVATDTANNSSSTSAAFAAAAPAVPPFVQVDTPAANATLTGTTTIGGWAIENMSTIGPHAVSSVTVFVDGSQVGSATYGVSRPDVCAVFPGRPGCPNVGWNYSLNVAALASGNHTLKIVATDTANNSSSTSMAFTAAAPAVPPFVYIDMPTAGANLSGTVTLAGWAIENINTVGPNAVSSVAVFVDGNQVGTANYGISRPDVCAAYPGRLGCPNVGWNYNLNVSAYPSGSHVLQIVATDTANNSSSTSVAFSSTTVAPPTYGISGTVTGTAATLILSGASSQSSTTNSSGQYTFPGLANGQYVITPGQTGYTFSPAATVIVINGAASTGVNFTGTATPHSVTLTWTPSNSPNILGFNVYRATTSGGPYAKITPSPISSAGYVDSGVTGGQIYYYATTAVNTSNMESDYSNIAVAIIPSP